MPHNGAMPHSHYHPDTRAPTVGPPLFTRVTRHPQTPYKGYLVSTFAYDNLIDDAAQHGWLLHESLTTAGLVHYIAAVFNFPHPAQEWVDTRPQYLIDESLRRLGLPTPPTRRPSPRPAVSLSPTTTSVRTVVGPRHDINRRSEDTQLQRARIPNGSNGSNSHATRYRVRPCPPCGSTHTALVVLHLPRSMGSAEHHTDLSADPTQAA
jgi:hypothetical protein